MSSMNRRDALKAFALVSTANFLDVGVPQLERTVRGMESLADPRLKPRKEHANRRTRQSSSTAASGSSSASSPTT